MDGDGSPDWALCVDTLPPCKAHGLLMSIAASIMQTQGQAQVREQAQQGQRHTS